MVLLVGLKNPLFEQIGGDGIGSKIEDTKLFKTIERRSIRFITPHDVLFDGASSGNIDNFSLMLFGTPGEPGVFGANLMIPADWAGRQLKFTAYVYQIPGGAGNAVWELGFQNKQPGTGGSDISLGMKTVAVPGVGNVAIIEWISTTLTLSERDLVAAYLYRRADDGADTYANTLSVILISIEKV